MQGDRVESVADAGGTTCRKGEAAVRRGVMEVSEVTRTGTVVRTARFMANWVPGPAERPTLRKKCQCKAG
ncbi:hypothetical protein ABZ016_28360 [Streptomyces sp. NPDC006372]|uniref:hypothetical protein n=1 Tax=Streptomyces sp. NPDC006372 TaxID=3155599 RepID=UPI0033B09F0C